MRGAREAPALRDSLNFRRASLLSRNEFESGTFTIALHATFSFTYVSVIYGANFPFNFRTQVPTFRMQVETGLGKTLPTEWHNEQTDEDEETAQEALPNEQARADRQQQQQQQQLQPQDGYVTRSGRVSRPPDRYSP